MAHMEILDAEVQLPNPGAEGGGLVGRKECLTVILRKCPNLLGIRAGRKDGGGWKPKPVWLKENFKAASLKLLPQTLMNF